MSAGIPADAVTFFAELSENNTRTWWKANAERYRTTVREPFLNVIDAIDTDLEWRTYRPQRDTRFTRDKTPYKEFIGAVTQLPAGTGYFVRIDQRGLLIGSGYPMMAKDQLARFRSAVDDPSSGEALVAAVRQAEAAAQLNVTTGRYEPLSTAPRGYPRTHPRIQWLRAKGVEIPQRIGTPDWLHTDQAADHIRLLLRRGSTITTWLDQHVGPSELSPEEIWAR